jgi:hypothetical protein
VSTDTREAEWSVIDYSIDGGHTWHHGRTVEAWVTRDPLALAGQREAVRGNVREWHGGVERVTTRVLAESDPRAAGNQPVPDSAPGTNVPPGTEAEAVRLIRQIVTSGDSDRQVLARVARVLAPF